MEPRWHVSDPALFLMNILGQLCELQVPYSKKRVETFYGETDISGGFLLLLTDAVQTQKLEVVTKEAPAHTPRHEYAQNW